MPISSLEFDHTRIVLRERSAIGLEPGKEYLVESRLNTLAKREGLDSLHDLIRRQRTDSSGYFERKIVEAMVTTETTFFRDMGSFEILRTAVLPDLLTLRSAERSLNFWCAASASGQEPYSVAMMLREYFPAFKGWTIRFIASDISNEMIMRAREGIYNQHEVSRGLPAKLLVKYFHKIGQDWQISQGIREMVEFREINLAQKWAPLPPMDIIFMRNVLIYFDLEMRKTVLEKAVHVLRPDGYLFLGSSESTIDFTGAFEHIDQEIAGCFRLKGAMPQLKNESRE
jgi:chemotaxis protein methyltransferase CheR